MFSFPPLARRIVAQRIVKTNSVVLIEQVCILPIGGGVWFPVRNLTKRLTALESSQTHAEKQLEDIKANVKHETDYINKEIDRIGFFTNTALIKDSDGNYKIADLRQLVDFRLGKKRELTTADKPKVKEVKFSNLSIQERPSKGNSNNGGNKSGKNN